MKHTDQKHRPAVRLTALLLTALLISGSFSSFAGASEEPAPAENPELAALLEEPLPEVEPDAEYIVRYTDQAVATAADEGSHWAQLDGEALEDALEDGTVCYYEEDATVTLLDDSDAQWEHSMVHLDAMEQIDADGTGIVIGVIDSGIADHAEFAGRLLPGHNCMDDSDDTTDTYGHGTKVAGILAAACDGTGISGMAPGASLVPLKAFDGKVTYISNLVTAIYEGTDTYHCDLLNMSFGTTKNSEALEYAVNYAASQGVIMVAAVGNNGTTAVQYPAGYDAVIGVGSINQDGSHTASSQCNESVFLSAPGVLMSTTTMDGSYGTCSGTSFAAPVVTGAIADLLTLDPELTADRLSALLSGTALDAGDAGYDTSYGWGILDLHAARNTLLSGTAFLDVTQEEYWFDAVVWAAGTGITNGTDSLHFSPGQRCNRAQIVTFLWRLAGKPAPTGTDMPYADVPAGCYYEQAVLWAVEQGITNGTDSSHFSPEQPCTRAQIVTFLWRLAGKPEQEAADLPFADVPAGCYYAQAVLWAAEKGITNGTDSSHFSPAQPCSRGQAVSLLFRYAFA